MNNHDTNRLLKGIAETVDSNSEFELYITVAVGGQLITGTTISEDVFFELEENKLLEESFQKSIKAERLAIMEKREKGEEVEFPHELKEYFIYLKNAYYIFGSHRFPSGGEGLSVQIRVSDISAFTFKAFNGN